MNATTTCSRCGTALLADLGCPRCAYEHALASSEADSIPPTQVPVPGGDGEPNRAPDKDHRPLQGSPSREELVPHFPALDIEEAIGRGGSGTVYRARQRQLDRRVALKVLDRRWAEGPSFAERFGREARALATLDHPGIVRVYDHGQAGPWFFLLLELVEGLDLRRLMREEPIVPRDALGIVVQISEALQYAHDRGVVHRDVKPENILLDTHGRVRSLDFGLAKILGEREQHQLTHTHQAMGTPHYMAPEQWETPLAVDHRADIYALGVVFYELLTGRVPLGRFEAPSKHARIDLRIDEVVLRALERDRERRYQRADDLGRNVEETRKASTARRSAARTASTGWASPSEQVATLRKGVRRMLSDPADRPFVVFLVAVSALWLLLGLTALVFFSSLR